MYAHECEYCGANLDPGEKCDCVRADAEKDRKYKKLLALDKEGQLKFRFEVA